MKATDGKLLGSPFAFKKCGQSGLEISDLFRNVSRFADDIAVIRSCYHESFIHGPALGLLQTGSVLLGHPSVGSWVLYGLGCESDNLPAYIVMTDGGFRIGSAGFSSGFLPAIYQGTLFRTEGSPIENLNPPFDPADQRVILNQVNQWNGNYLAERPDDTRLAAQLSNYELAFRMQTAAPELIDISKESQTGAHALRWQTAPGQFQNRGPFPSIHESDGRQITGVAVRL